MYIYIYMIYNSIVSFVRGSHLSNTACLTQLPSSKAANDVAKYDGPRHDEIRIKSKRCRIRQVALDK